MTMSTVNFGHVKGADGHGVPAGGDTGRLLQKTSGTDYDTRWATAAQASSALGLALAGLIKGNGSGGFTAAVSGTDYRKPRTLLWSGSWSSGDITVTGISAYSRIEAVVSIYSLPGIINGSLIRAGAIAGLSSSYNITVAVLAASISGDVLTMQQCGTGTITTTPGYSASAAAVTAIYGID